MVKAVHITQLRTAVDAVRALAVIGAGSYSTDPTITTGTTTAKAAHINQLRTALDDDVPALTRLIREGKPLFPEYTGRQPEGPVARAVPGAAAVWSSPELTPPPDLVWQTLGSTHRWGASHDADALVVLVSGTEAAGPPSQVLVRIEPRRLWPCKQFFFVPRGDTLAELSDVVGPQSVEGRIVKSPDGWRAAVRIPLARIGREAGQRPPLRLDVQIVHKGGRESWRPSHPKHYRLNLGTENPADLGWMLFEPARE